MGESMMDLIYKQNLESAVRNALKGFSDLEDIEVIEMCNLANALVNEGTISHNIGNKKSIDTYHIFLLEYIMRSQLVIRRLLQKVEKLTNP